MCSINPGTSIGVDAESWCVGFIKISNSGGACYGCSLRATFRLNGVVHNYLNGWF